MGMKPRPEDRAAYSEQYEICISNVLLSTEYVCMTLQARRSDTPYARTVRRRCVHHVNRISGDHGHRQYNRDVAQTHVHVLRA